MRKLLCSAGGELDIIYGCLLALGLGRDLVKRAKMGYPCVEWQAYLE